MKRFLLNFVSVAVFVLLFSINSFAEYCACCSEKGYYSISYSKATEFQIGELERIKFDPTAALYMNAAGEDAIKGISSIADAYNLTGSFLNPTWKLNFKNGNKSGNLTLPMPLKILSYKVDTHEDDGKQGDPVLYKEWRFEGTTSGTGIFQNGIAPMTKYFLVLQGRGNLCDSASDFTHWRLEITGKKAGYAFFGKLKND